MDDSHFQSRTRAIAELCHTVPCKRVVTTAARGGDFQLSPGCEPDAWLEDARNWGTLAASAEKLLELRGDELRRLSPLEIRLQVGVLAATGQPPNCLASRRQLSKQLLQSLTGKWAAVPSMWSKLALIRTPFKHETLTALGGQELTPEARDMVVHCLLSVHQNRLSLHDLLRRDSPKCPDASEVHGLIASAQKETALAGPLRDTLSVQLENFYHRVESAQPEELLQADVLHQDQWNILGRQLSQRRSNFESATHAFEKALELDNEDDYAHHNLALNLQHLRRNSQQIEQHYLAAIAINPANPEWWSAQITFLIIRGRMADAERTWDQARDSLGLPDPSAGSELYSRLHLSVAWVSVQRAQLDFAAIVLDEVPEQAKKRDRRIRAVERRIKSLHEAELRGGVLPLPYLQPEWWLKGPSLAFAPPASDMHLSRWLPGRLDSKSDGQLHFRVAVVSQPPAAEPPLARISVDEATFASWLPPVPAAELCEGSFVEFFEFKRKMEPNGAQMRVTVHRLPEYLVDPDLPDGPSTEPFLACR